MTRMTPSELHAVQMIGEELRAIRQVLELLIAPPQEPPSTQELTCPHPEDQRINFGMTNGEPDWECRLCHQRSIVP